MTYHSYVVKPEYLACLLRKPWDNIASMCIALVYSCAFQSVSTTVLQLQNCLLCNFRRDSHIWSGRH